MTATPNRLPRARVSGLITNHQGDSCLVYDTATHHLHTLNREMTAVWQRCDGQHTPTDLAVATALPMGEVQVALTGLAQAGLLEHPFDPAYQVGSQTRRRLLKRAAVAGTLPAIISITAPTAAQSSSSCTRNDLSCLTDGDCCSGHCYRGTKTCKPATCVHAGGFCLTDSFCCSGGCIVGTCA